MCKAKDFRLLQLQASIFTPALLFRGSHIFKDMMAKYAEMFDGEPLSFPLPADIPKDVPKIILQSANKKLKLEVAESRVNFFRFLQEDEADIDRGEFFDKCINVFDSYIKSTSATVGRTALVSLKFLKHENPGKQLAVHFCKENFITEPFNRPENFELHSHKKYVVEDFNVNSWVRCKTGKLQKDDSPIVLVQQDINTLAEETDKNQFSIGLIKKFIATANKEQIEILKKYFPDK